MAKGGNNEKENNSLYVSDNKNNVTYTTYQIDFSKVNDVEDIKTILWALNITITDRYDKFEGLKHLLKKVDG